MSSEENHGFLSIDGPYMRTMDLVIHLLLLNILTIICSLPIITAGAAFTALNHQLYRMSYNKEGYVVKDFFVDFKSNFKISTKTWIPVFLVGLFLGIDLKIFYEGVSFPVYFKWAIISFTIIYLYGLVYLFPVLARYEMTPKEAIKCSLAMALHGKGIIKTLIMIALYVVPWIAAMYVANFVLANLLFGISLPAYINVFLYRKTFEEFEAQREEADEEEQ